MPGELPGGRQAVDGQRAEQLGLLERQRLARVLGELGLVVEQIHVRRAAGHEQEDDALGLGRVVRRHDRQRVGPPHRPDTGRDPPADDR